MNAPDAVAQRLVQAYRQRAPIQANPSSGPAGIDAAYAAQRTLWQAMVGVIGRPPLGDIFHCLPWLAHVGGARTGDIVTTGAWRGMHPVGLAAEVAVAFAGLGKAHAWIGARQAPA